MNPNSPRAPSTASLYGSGTVLLSFSKFVLKHIFLMWEQAMTGGLRFLRAGVLIGSMVAMGHAYGLMAEDDLNVKPGMLESKLEVTAFDPAMEIEARQEHGNWPWAFVFEGPARFERLGFDRQGIQVPREALTIYEGMTVWVHRNGRYKVRFRADAPLTPATIRLQLTVLQASETPGTITLPPIRIKPTLVSDGNSPTQPFLVTYSGTSDVLTRLVRKMIAGLDAQRSLAEVERRKVKIRLDEALNSQSQALKQLKAAKKKLDAAREPSEAIMTEVKEANERLETAKLSVKSETAAYNATKKLLKNLQAAVKTTASDLPAEPWSLKEYVDVGITFERRGTARFGTEPQR